MCVCLYIYMCVYILDVCVCKHIYTATTLDVCVYIHICRATMLQHYIVRIHIPVCIHSHSVHTWVRALHCVLCAHAVDAMSVYVYTYSKTVLQY